MAARHSIDLRADGILDIAIAGLWSLAEVDVFFAELQPIATRARLRHGRVLSMIAVQSVQSPIVAFDVSKRALAIKQPGGRNAFLIATMLAKLQIQRLGSQRDLGVFTHRPTAEAWLKSG